MEEDIMKYFRLIIISVCLFMLCGCNSQQEYSTRDIAQYRNFSGHIEMEESDFFSGVQIFPQSISEEMEEVTYLYECGSAALDNNYLIYLECRWDEAAFEIELERIGNLSVTYEGEKKDIVLEETGFSYPAYVAIYDEELMSMEYALFNEKDKRIIYIYSQLNADLEEKIDSEYLKKENADFGNEMLNAGYNMYYFEIADGVGEYVK